MDIVFACDTRIVGDPKTGAGRSVVTGQHWPADDPVVVAYPELFTDDPRYGLSSSRPLDIDGYPTGATETASAAPGEKRQSRRPSGDGK